MVFLRFSHFVFQLLLLLVFLAISNIQALDFKGFQTSTGKITTTRDGGGVTKAEIDVRTRMWDRSSFNRKMLMKFDKVLYIDETSNISKKSNLKVKPKLKKNKSKLVRSKNGQPVNVTLRNFMVLNADYHVPRPHPPKNN